MKMPLKQVDETYSCLAASRKTSKEDRKFRREIFLSMAKALAVKKLGKYDKSLYPKGLIKKRCPLCGGVLHKYGTESGWQTLADVFNPLGIYPHGGMYDDVAIYYYHCDTDDYRFPIKLKYTWELINNI